MSVLLAHLDLSMIIYGVIMFLGLAIMFGKLMHGAYFSFLIDVAVFSLVFRLHGGTMAGGFAAMIAAMLAGLFFPMMFRRKFA